MHDTSSSNIAIDEATSGGGSFALVRDATNFGTTVSAFGDFDFSTSPALEEQLLEAGIDGAPLAVDMSECRYLDASAMSVFIRVQKRFGERLRIVAPPGCAAFRLLRLCDLIGPLGVYRNVAEAQANSLYAAGYDSRFAATA
jgi:anti-anti-sigma regulatory factor